MSLRVGLFISRRSSAMLLCVPSEGRSYPRVTNPGRQTLVPAESTWSGSGGDNGAEALEEKARDGGSADHAGRNVQ